MGQKTTSISQTDISINQSNTSTSILKKTLRTKALLVTNVVVFTVIFIMNM